MIDKENMKTFYLDSYPIYYIDFGEDSTADTSYYFQSQIHGNETFSTLVLIELIDRLLKRNKDDFLSKIRIVPRINPFSWYNYLSNWNGRLDNSKLDWNRAYSLNNIEELLKKHKMLSFEEKLILIRDFLRNKINTTVVLRDKVSSVALYLSLGFTNTFDVHTPENGIEHLYINKFTKEKDNFNIKNIIEYNNPTLDTFDESTNRIYNKYFYNDNYISITLELPSNVPATTKEVNQWVDNIENGLIKNHAIKGNTFKKPINSTYFIGDMVDYISEVNGIIKYNFTLGDKVKKGKILAEIFSFDYINLIQIIYANNDCKPLCLRKKNMIEKNNWVIRVIEAK